MFGRAESCSRICCLHPEHEPEVYDGVNINKTIILLSRIKEYNQALVRINFNLMNYKKQSLQYTSKLKTFPAYS